jgi:hypothetical protein
MGATAFSPTDVDDLARTGPVVVGGRDRFDGAAVVVGGSDQEVFSVEFVDELVARASAAVEMLQMLDVSLLSKDAVSTFAIGTERLRRQVDAVGVNVAGHVDRTNPFRRDGTLSVRAWLKHRLQLSGVEAHRRIQVARMQALLPLWANGAAAGMVGVAQSEVMAQVAANPRLEPEVLRRGAWELFRDAIDLPFKDFEANARKWEKLADPVGAAEQSERNRVNRDAEIKPQRDGSWHLTASFDDIGGAEFADIFGHYVQAEWDADWAEATARVGDKANMFDLRRTQSQRRADALLAMARAAAAAPPWSKRPLPAVSILIDDATFEAVLKGEHIDPLKYRDVVSRTQSGHELHAVDVVNAALWGEIRRAVYDAASVVIDLGRKQRLFKGSSREAVMLLATVCAWVGCDAKAEWCQADHSIGWKAHGCTVPRNGGPLCCRHNLLKEQGYRVSRDADGTWHTYDPDGAEIL